MSELEKPKGSPATPSRDMPTSYPPGYHITWGTYGARLHGSTKPHVDLRHNEPGAPFPPADPAREQAMRDRMKSDPVRLTIPQRKLVESTLIDLAKRYTWKIHAIAPQTDHVHVVITAMREGPELREALKATVSRALNKEFGKRKWWAEGGSAKYLWERPYFDNAVGYVLRQRGW